MMTSSDGTLPIDLQVGSSEKFSEHDAEGNGVSTTSQAPPHHAKRNRIQLSCTPCRHAKLKCDREDPCTQCIKKGRASTCTFVAPAARRKPPASMQKRLNHLERLVKDAMNGQNLGREDVSHNDGPPSGVEVWASSSLPATSGSVRDTSGRGDAQAPKTSLSEEPPSTSSGQVLLGPHETTYVGATHWAAILDDIEEVKSYFNQGELHVDIPDENAKSNTSLIFKTQPAATKLDLLAALPPRPVVDQLVSRYFNSTSPAIHIIHKPTFQKEYRMFWSDPTCTPVSWLGLLYALMSLAMFAVHGNEEENPDPRGTPMAMLRAYRDCCAQCLVLSNYTSPGVHTLETFLFYMEGEFILSEHDQVNCYLLIGVAVRLALRMGLHRDSTRVFGRITAFQCEIRRRIWYFLVQIDLLVSFHIGLPSMVQGIQSDTFLPGNFMDEDFDEDSTELPPSRPDTDRTVMSYTICKSRICKVFGSIAAQANLLSLPSYEQVMELDNLLHQSYAKVPSFLKIRSMELSVIDSAELVIQRFSIALLFHKSRCVLHRKFLLKQRADPCYAYSKDAALDASMELLYYQSAIYDAAQPGGRLSRDRWFLSSLSMHDFLLAAMIVYLSTIQAMEGSTSEDTINQQNQKMINALERSASIWKKSQSRSADSKKASKVLCFMIEKITLTSGGIDVSKRARREGGVAGPNGPATTPELTVTGLLAANHASNHYSGATNPLQHGTLENESTSSVLGTHFDPDYMMATESLAAMIDMPINFDWDAFDNHVRPPQASDQPWLDVLFEDFGFGTTDDSFQL